MTNSVFYVIGTFPRRTTITCILIVWLLCNSRSQLAVQSIFPKFTFKCQGHDTVNLFAEKTNSSNYIPINCIWSENFKNIADIGNLHGFNQLSFTLVFFYYFNVHNKWHPCLTFHLNVKCHVMIKLSTNFCWNLIGHWTLLKVMKINVWPTWLYKGRSIFIEGKAFSNLCNIHFYHVTYINPYHMPNFMNGIIHLPILALFIIIFRKTKVSQPTV